MLSRKQASRIKIGGLCRKACNTLISLFNKYSSWKEPLFAPCGLLEYFLMLCYQLLLFQFLVVLQADIFDQAVDGLWELVLQALVQRLRGVKYLHPMDWLRDLRILR